MIPSELKYSKEHEWVRVDGSRATIGITHHAQDQLGDIVFVELPEVGRQLRQGDTFGVVESVKTVSDLYAPLTGKVLEVNPKLVESESDFEPEVVNTSPYEDGWMLVLELEKSEELEGLMSADAYGEFAESES